MLGSQLLLDVPEGWEAVATDLVGAREGGPPVDAPGVDLADETAVEGLFAAAGPFVGVIHAAAYTAVDRAEEEEAAALRANAEVPRVVAAACARAGIPGVFVGTDFVFDGSATEPYEEDAPTSPLSAYGRTKLAGEEAVVREHPDGARIVRTQWLYGPRGAHFPGTILRLARERGELRVVDDQRGSPTSTLELAPALWDVLRLGEPGIYHGACEGSCSWYDFALASIEGAGLTGVRLEPCATAEFPRPAPRPAFSVLSCRRLTALRGRSLAHWHDALGVFLAREGPAADRPSAR
jgi:dTDP-4-dehydrorhamnose reductase